LKYLRNVGNLTGKVSVTLLVILLYKLNLSVILLVMVRNMDNSYFSKQCY